MEIATVDEGDAHIGTREIFRGIESAKPATDNDYVHFFLAHTVDCTLKRGYNLFLHAIQPKSKGKNSLCYLCRCFWGDDGADFFTL